MKIQVLNEASEVTFTVYSKADIEVTKTKNGKANEFKTSFHKKGSPEMSKYVRLVEPGSVISADSYFVSASLDVEEGWCNAQMLVDENTARNAYNILVNTITKGLPRNRAFMKKLGFGPKNDGELKIQRRR